MQTLHPTHTLAKTKTEISKTIHTTNARFPTLFLNGLLQCIRTEKRGPSHTVRPRAHFTRSQHKRQHLLLPSAPPHSCPTHTLARILPLTTIPSSTPRDHAPPHRLPSLHRPPPSPPHSRKTRAPPGSTIPPTAHPRCARFRLPHPRSRARPPHASSARNHCTTRRPRSRRRRPPRVNAVPRACRYSAAASLMSPDPGRLPADGPTHGGRGPVQATVVLPRVRALAQRSRDTRRCRRLRTDAHRCRSRRHRPRTRTRKVNRRCGRWRRHYSRGWSRYSRSSKRGWRRRVSRLKRG